MRKAFKVSSGGKVGVVVPDEVAHQIAGAVHAVLLEHMDELVAVNWTLNYAYREDGDQVVCHYPDLLKRFSKEERVAGMLTAEELHIRRVNYTDETDRDKVAEMCAMVARGEMEVES